MHSTHCGPCTCQRRTPGNGHACRPMPEGRQFHNYLLAQRQQVQQIAHVFKFMSTVDQSRFSSSSSSSKGAEPTFMQLVMSRSASLQRACAPADRPSHRSMTIATCECASFKGLHWVTSVLYKVFFCKVQTHAFLRSECECTSSTGQAQADRGPDCISRRAIQLLHLCYILHQ